MTLQSNPELELAFDYVRNTSKNLFLTGKAGSGKTTFLHQLKTDRLKRMAIAAPTGVAAINAGGMTLHSLFQIPVGLHLPGMERQPTAHQPRYRAEKIRLIRSLDLLVIDEISMVRADLLDAVDQVLQRFRGHGQPFGGVQLLMIGDLHQLPPVVRPDEWDLLRKYYETPYFFGSTALRQTDYVSIELKHIYRQADSEFIGLLNQVRNSRLDGAALEKLNSRFRSNFIPPADQPYITLTATNAAANAINHQNLERLPGKLHSFPAEVVGDFPSGSYPTEEVLEFKVGSQVMFIRNDTSPAKRYFNGRLGRVTSIDDDGITVHCPDDGQGILVQPAEWKNVRYSLNEETKQVEEQIKGSFTQYPLRLAWAITIHKSQGLTFDRCIIDAQAAFATGQVYVALSRCRTFEGIVLRSRIEAPSVKTDPVVQQYSRQAEENLPTASQLQQAKREYQSTTIGWLFQFDEISRPIGKLLWLCREHAPSILEETHDQCRQFEARAAAELMEVSKKFAPQLAQYLNEADLPEANTGLQNRVRKASVYFTEKLGGLAQEAKQLTAATDNKEVAGQFRKAIDALQLSLAIKHACFAACQNGFSAEAVGRAKVDAELDFTKKDAGYAERSNVVPKGIPHPDLYRQLLQWRSETAKRNSIKDFEVAPNASLKELVITLPIENSQLRNVTGIGKGRLRRFGTELLDIIRKYRHENQITQAMVDPIASSNRPASGASQTKQISLAMFRAGKSIREIAEERRLVFGTIAGHLAHFVSTGEVDVFSLLEPEKVEEIQQYFFANPKASSSEAKSHFGSKYEYGELKMVMGYIAAQRSKPQEPHGSTIESR
jgi:hypothetical protein